MLNPKLRFLGGDSELAGFFLAKDWSNHILGPPENWAQELKTTVSLMLSSKFPMSLAWGKERIFLYNDTYAKLMGEKHPEGLGEKYEILWSEVWKEIVPILEKVDQGESLYLEDLQLTLTRHNITEECYFTFSYSPIQNQDGTTAGLFCTVVETTTKVLSQRQLANERDKLNIIFKESSTVMAMLQGPEMVYELVNPRYQALFDRELIGKPLLEAIPELKGQPFAGQLKNVLETGIPSFGHEVLAQHRRTPHGPIEDRYYDFTFARVNDVNGVPYGIYVHGFDSTDHVLAKRAIIESQERFRIITNALPIIFWTANPDAYVDWYNDWWYKYCGVPRGTEWDDANLHPMHPEDVILTNITWPKTVAAGENFIMEQRFRRGSDGQYRWHKVQGAPVRDENGKITKYVGGNTDIHDQKMLAEDLKIARTYAESANQSKSNFLANMSHEIRTPLAAILGFSTLLNESNLDADTKNHYVETIVRNGKSLSRIIDDILDLAKVEAGKLDFENVSFSLYQLATEIVDLFKDKTKEKDIFILLSIDDDVPSQLVSDPTRIRQILINLVGNAVKFTDNGGVRVNVSSAPLDGNKTKITINVKDTGIGLSLEQREKLFSPFMQADNSITRKFGGTGLGLALSQRLSEALSGEISIPEGSLGQGSTFRLTFTAGLTNDIPKIESRTENTAKTKSKALEGLRILIVDDTEDNRLLISRLLMRNSAKVDTASNGDEGAHKALSGSYDVVLMDLQMPLMDGYQAKQVLDEKGYNKPVIALTAHAMNEERLKTKAAGFSGHLTKPATEIELVNMILHHTTRLL